jgi:hypothetical protein
MDNVMWGFLGWVTGILTLMQVQVLREHRRRNNPAQINPNFIPMEERLKPKVDWDAAAKTELADDAVKIVPRTLTPAAPVAMQECPECGLAFKRVKTHIARKHPAAAPPSDLQVVPELGDGISDDGQQQ